MARFEYTVEKLGPKKWVVVYDNSSVIYTGAQSFSSSESLLIEEAKVALEGDYPGVRDMVLKGSTPVEPIPPVDPPVQTPVVEPVVEPPVQAPVVPVEPPVVQPTIVEMSFPEPSTSTSPPIEMNKQSSTFEVISRSNKKLTSLQMSYKEGVKDRDANSYAEDIGKMPLIVINGVTIESKDITFFKLYNDRYLPEIEMTFTDPTNKIFDSQYPLDQQVVSIMIKSNESLLMPIRMDFWITEFTSIKSDRGDYKNYRLVAKLNVPYIITHASWKGSSYDVLKSIAEEADLGFASNINTTNDSMTWVNCGIDYVREQIPEIVKRAYIDDDTFLYAYIDFWYNLNYVDIEQQLKLTTEGDANLSGNERLTGEKSVIPLILSNHPDYNQTSQFFDKFNLINNSTEVNYDLGYKPHIYYYMVKEKNVSNILLDTISTKGDKGDKIVLKGQPQDNNYNLRQEKNYFLGKNDTDNSHSNYLYAEQSNYHNLEFLQKIRMNIILPNLNFQLYRFQPVNIQIYKLRELDSEPNAVTVDDVKSSKNVDKYKLNERLSGDWLIMGINFTYIGDNKKMVQEITVARRELSAAKIAKN